MPVLPPPCGLPWLWSFSADSSSVGRYCVTITRQQIFEGLLLVTVVGVLSHVVVERHADIVAGNANDRVNADSGKPHSYTMWKEAWVNGSQRFHKFEKSTVNVRPSRRHGGALVGLARSNKIPTPRLKYETLEISGVFVKFECQALPAQKSSSPEQT